MPRLTEPRIAPDAAAEVTHLIFGEDLRLSGTRLAAELGENHTTVWAWMNRSGIPLDQAEQIALILEAHAHRAIRAASRLRALAADARGVMGAGPS